MNPKNQILADLSAEVGMLGHREVLGIHAFLSK